MAGEQVEKCDDPCFLNWKHKHYIVKGSSSRFLRQMREELEKEGL